MAKTAQGSRRVEGRVVCPPTQWVKCTMLPLFYILLLPHPVRPSLAPEAERGTGGVGG